RDPRSRRRAHRQRPIDGRRRQGPRPAHRTAAPGDLQSDLPLHPLGFFRAIRTIRTIRTEILIGTLTAPRPAPRLCFVRLAPRRSPTAEGRTKLFAARGLRPRFEKAAHAPRKAPARPATPGQEARRETRVTEPRPRQRP